VASASKPHTPEGVKHRHAPTKTPGIYTSSNGKPGGLRWEVKYTDPATGKQAWSSVFKRRQDALSFQAEVRGKVDKGTVIGNPSMTFRALVAEWKVVRDARVSEGTASSQDMHLRVHILPLLGNRKVRDISRATVLQWQAGIKRKDGRVGPPAPSTVNLIRATLSSVLDHAVAAGVIAVNPCKTLARGEKPKGEQKEKTILADGDLDKLLRAVGRRTWMADVIQVALGQALRLGEVAGLDWKDVDFETNRLNVARSVSKKTGAIGVPKGGRAATIPLTPSTRKVLARLHLAAGRPATGPVFASDGQVEGGYRHPSTIERGFADAYRRSGIETPGLGMHSLRHTAISHLANNPAVPLSKVQRFARHSSITITEQYVHDIETPEVEDEMGATLDAIG
jgi:integrase